MQESIGASDAQKIVPTVLKMDAIGKVNQRMTVKKSICFISETGRAERPILDPSVRYRCFHAAEVFLREGHNCVVYSAENFYKNACLDFDIYIFHRPNTARKNFYQITAFLKKMQKILIADYDDLIFGDAEIALQSSAVKNHTLTEEKAIAAFATNLEALRCFDRVSVSTGPLADKVQLFNEGASTKVVSNFLPPSFVKFHQEYGTPYKKRNAHAIGYFAGTKSHDKDLPIVEEVLYRVLLEDERKTLLIVGPVKVPRALSALPNVSLAPACSFLRLPSLMVMCSTVIAPLEDSTFNQCKSRVKFLEASLAGCRLVASPIPDMVTVGNRLHLAQTKNDWYEALTDMPPDGRDMTTVADNFDQLMAADFVRGLKELGEFQ